MRLLLLATTVGAALTGTGCSGPRQPGPPRRDVLRLALAGDLRTLDPSVSSDFDSQPLVRLVNEGLLDYDDGTGLRPWLAETLPEVEGGGRVFTLRLREGVRFSTGRRLTAEDCVYSIERSLDPGTRSWGDGFLRSIRGATAFQRARERDREAAPDVEASRRPRIAEPRRVAGLRALDDRTLRIELDRPDPAFPYVLTMTFTYPVPREEVERSGEDFFRRPVGTGPFVLKEWRRGLRVRFERNPDYWGPQPPRLDGVTMQLSTDELVQQMMFERGELDLLAGIPEPDFLRITRDRHWGPLVAVPPANETSSFFMNTELPPFTDRRVRQALNYAVNRPRLLRLLNGRAREARGVIPPAMTGFDPTVRGYRYDPERARALLKEAGYPDGFTVPIFIGAASRSLKLAQAVQQDLAAVGVRLELQTVAGGVAGQMYRKRRTVQMGIQTWYMDYPDPGNFLDTFLNGERITDENCLNFAFYSNPEVTELIRAASREADPGRRTALWRRAERKVMEDAPWLFLYHPLRHRLRQPWVGGFTTHPVWPGRYEQLWFRR